MPERHPHDRFDDEDQERYDRFGYPDPTWVESDQEWLEEQAAFEREGRYFDAPLRTPERVSDDWLEDEWEEAA